MLWTITTRTRALIGHATAPQLAETLLTVAGAALAATLFVGALRGILPLGPLLTWLGAMALLGVVAVASMAALRKERVHTLVGAALTALKVANSARHGAPTPYRLPPSPRA